MPFLARLKLIDSADRAHINSLSAVIVLAPSVGFSEIMYILDKLTVGLLIKEETQKQHAHT